MSSFSVFVCLGSNHLVGVFIRCGSLVDKLYQVACRDAAWLWQLPASPKFPGAEKWQFQRYVIAGAPDNSAMSLISLVNNDVAHPQLHILV